MTDTSPDEIDDSVTPDHYFGGLPDTIPVTNNDAVPTPTDDMGRPAVSSMTDRALLEEIVFNMRATVDAVSALEQLPIVKAMQNGENPLLAMMRKS